jgi:hypothetical protein
MKLKKIRKPKSGIGALVQTALNVALPIVLLLFVLGGFSQLAFILVILSKWRTFAVRPRFWLANMRANSIDLFVGLSVVVFLTYTSSIWWQLLWTVLYIGWLVYIKPKSSVFFTSLQAGIGFLAALMALFLELGGGPLFVLVLVVGVISYLAARHFFANFDEPYAKLLSYLWGYFAAAMMWVLGHWLLFYGLVAQPTVLLVALGAGLGTLYYLDHFDKLSVLLRRQFIFIMVAVVIVVLALSNWSNTVG